METPKRLVPYSVHLPEDIYLKMKKAATERKASAMVRDAIVMMIEGNDVYNSGYRKGVRDSMNIVNQNEGAKTISYGGSTIAESIVTDLEFMIK
jgi:hypothetical protein